MITLLKLITVDEMGVDELGVDKIIKVDEMGTRRSGNKPSMAEYKQEDRRYNCPCCHKICG